jgi:cystathionine beta-lyase
MTHTDTLVTILGRDRNAEHGAVNPPVHHTSTLLFENLAQMRAYERGEAGRHAGYARNGHPTMKALADAMAQLEGYEQAFITSSGLAATVLALLSVCNSGDHILVTDSLYGCTRKFMTKELTRMGVEVEFYNPTISAEGIAAMMKENTRLIYVESPGSQTFEVQDIPALAGVAHAAGALIISDSTWATPFFQDSPALGIDINIQSVTKYIAGHSDLVMGAVCVSGALVEQVKRTFLNTGMCAGSDNIYLALRGLRSVKARLRQHAESAMLLAGWLEQQPQVKRVLYPALESDPGHAIWKRDMTGACGLFAIELADGSYERTEAFVNALHHFGIGYSWGGYESLVTAYQPANFRTASNWDKDCWLIRLNIGLEAVEDLREDLEGALKAASAVR